MHANVPDVRVGGPLKKYQGCATLARHEIGALAAVDVGQLCSHLFAVGCKAPSWTGGFIQGAEALELYPMR